jgi:lipid-A-disaccharide synthase
MSIFISSGELSGDEHTAPIVKELKSLNPEIAVFGMGANNLQAAGMDLVIDSSHEGSVMGLTEVLGHVRKLFKASKVLLEQVDQRKPKVAILVDFPDFNLRMAKKLKKRGIKVIYFISPQLWAWRSGRIKHIKKYVDIVLPIFPFEEKFYIENNVKAKYVGHPFLSREEIRKTKLEIRQDFGIDESTPLIALLPGSRKSEVREILPNLIATKKIISSKNPNIKFVIPIAPSVTTFAREILNELNQEDVKDLILVDGQAREVLKAADVSIVASGTATVEAALSETPFCIVYKVSKITYAIGKRLITGVKYVGMPNLISDQEIVKEFIQDKFDPENVSAHVLNLLNDTSLRDETIQSLKKVKQKLSGDGLLSVDKEVAKIISQML